MRALNSPPGSLLPKQAASTTNPESAGAKPRWLLMPTLPGPSLEDGTHFRDVFMLPGAAHVAATFGIGLALLGMAWAYWGDPRWQFVAWSVLVGGGALLEGWAHYSTWSFHKIHSRWTLAFVALSLLFLAVGGWQAMMSGPRDYLFVDFVVGFPAATYAAAASFFMTLRKSSGVT